MDLEDLEYVYKNSLKLLGSKGTTEGTGKFSGVIRRRSGNHR